MGVICGVTTNPSLIAKEGRDFNEVLKEITSIVDGPISGEVKATTVDAEGMIAEGREIAKLHPNMVVKIPMTVEGLKAIKVDVYKRQDSTNAVQNTLVACITAIGKDHTELLGDTYEKIAYEKCGILKNHCAAIVYPVRCV